MISNQFFSRDYKRPSPFLTNTLYKTHYLTPKTKLIFNQWWRMMMYTCNSKKHIKFEMCICTRTDTHFTFIIKCKFPFQKTSRNYFVWSHAHFIQRNIKQAFISKYFAFYNISSKNMNDTWWNRDNGFDCVKFRDTLLFNYLYAMITFIKVIFFSFHYFFIKKRRKKNSLNHDEDIFKLS